MHSRLNITDDAFDEVTELLEEVLEDFGVNDEANHLITCSGGFRLTGVEYAPIVELLNQAADAKPECIILDIRKLRFLNSSGITKFVVRVRKHNTSKVIVKGSRQFPWQGKSLKNLTRLLPTLELD